MAIESQADQRRPAMFRDQHDRRWSASVENKTGVPAGLIMPEFSVPDPRLMPPMVYLRFDPRGDPGRLRIDYDSWEAEAEDATKAHQLAYAEYAALLPGGTANPMFVRLVGARPMSPVPIRAMRQGNKWALGLSDVKPPEAHDFFPDPIKLPTEPVFSGPVYSQQEEQKAVRQKDAGQLIQERMAELEKDCPAELKGFAKTKWILAQLKGESVAQEA